MLALLVLAAAAAPLPDYFKLPKGSEVRPNMVVEVFGQAEIHDAEFWEARGHHWQPAIVVQAAKEKEIPLVWAELKKSLLAAGWAVKSENLPTYAVLSYKKSGKDTVATFSLFGWDDVRADVVEQGNFARTVTLKAPAAKPEVVPPGKDWPYFTPPPGTKLTPNENPEAGAFYAHEKGQDEPVFVSDHSVTKEFSGDSSYSPLELVVMYRDAFTKAGWRIVEESQGLHQGDAVMVAQYNKNGRNIWLSWHNTGSGLSVTVADVGAVNLQKALEKECHVALSGVNFDFNQATLRPESAPVLEKVAAVLKAAAGLVVEVQGHTDNVGGDASNQKLSEARAETVRAWLTAHQIDAKRLSSKGYGKSQPVAENETPEGRAKNRRVELRRADCK